MLRKRTEELTPKVEKGGEDERQRAKQTCWRRGEKEKFYKALVE